MTDDLEQKAELARKENALQRQIEVEELRAVLASPAGANVMRRIIARCGLFRLSYDPASDRETCRREGERNVGLWLVHEIESVEPGNFARLSLNTEQTEITA